MESHAVVVGVVVVSVILAGMVSAPKNLAYLDVPPRECLSDSILLQTEGSFLHHF